mmetsp:Transcript_2190/g.2121  ORF Transcript_2190/g.2121 Transcript_2190/m.2121 type:complete len:123 (-) Transcript_2190:68-436(-)
MVVKVLSGALMSQFIAERSIGGDSFRGSLSLLIDQAFKLQLLHFVIELHLLVLQPLWGGVPGFKVKLLLVVQLLSFLIVVVLWSLQRARGVQIQLVATFLVGIERAFKVRHCQEILLTHALL